MTLYWALGARTTFYSGSFPYPFYQIFSVGFINNLLGSILVFPMPTTYTVQNNFQYHSFQKACEGYKPLTNERPTWCHLLFYFTYYALNMFRTLIYPSSGACDCVDELPHRSSCSQFVVCWSFGAARFGWCSFCRLKHNCVCISWRLLKENGLYDLEDWIIGESRGTFNAARSWDFGVLIEPSDGWNIKMI